MTLCSIGVVARRYGVSASTIRRWAAKGLVKIALRTLGGHRRFELDAETPAGASGERKHIGYARVSSHDPKADLQRQAQRLKASGCEEVITDIGSGLNCSKPGLRRLLNCILQGKVHTLSVVHEDRLLRFGTALVRWLCRKMHTEIRVLDARPAKTFEEELAKDVITLMTVFCARLYGKRSHQSKKAAAKISAGGSRASGAFSG